MKMATVYNSDPSSAKDNVFNEAISTHWFYKAVITGHSFCVDKTRWWLVLLDYWVRRGMER